MNLHQGRNQLARVRSSDKQHAPSMQESPSSKPTQLQGQEEWTILDLRRKTDDIIQDTFSLLFSTVALLWVFAPSC
jgi:hypothetical protein